MQVYIYIYIYIYAKERQNPYAVVIYTSEEQLGVLRIKV